MFKLRFAESQLSRWATKYDYTGSDDVPWSIGRKARRRGYLLSCELRDIARWKSPRSSGHCSTNTDTFVREVTQTSFSTTDARLKVEVLRLLDGVGWPTASAILHYRDRERWPIIDFRAFWSLGVEMPPGKYDFAVWEAYTECTRTIANRQNIDMRSVDRALWSYSKANQPARLG